MICSIHFKPDDFVPCLDFKEKERILLTQWLKQEESGKSRFSINSCICCWETAVSQRSPQRQKAPEQNSARMFSTLICLSFLPWSILNLKEKSGRVILAELNSFWSHVVNKYTGLEDPSFSKQGHAARYLSKEMLRIGTYRTPEHPKSSRTISLFLESWQPSNSLQHW